MKKIYQLEEHDRPREKIKERGAAALSNNELIAAVIGSGNAKCDVFKLAMKLNDLFERQRTKPKYDDLIEIDGVGEATAIRFVAAFELTERLKKQNHQSISMPSHVLPYLKEYEYKKQEYFICITLNGANQVISRRIVTKGTLNKAHVHPREVFLNAIEDRAASIIVSHNHPSGNLTPSMDDKKITHRLYQSGEILGIPLLDHIIISFTGYFSFKDNDILLPNPF